MTERSRIVLNTFATYSRSLVALFLGLFSARWVLLGLGQSDFGLYGVVGSIIAFITFLNSTLSGAVSRFFAYAIGESRNQPEAVGVDNLCRWFNVAMCIHLVLPLALALIGYPIGVYAIQHWLVIPVDRMEACLLVFKASVTAAFFGMISVPFTALFQAHQLIFELSFLGILNVMVLFTIAYSLMSASGDRLVYYATCMMAVTVVSSLVQVVWAVLRFRSCRLRLQYWLDGTRLKDFFAFAGSKFFGAVCVILRTQGGVLLLNSFFTPQINAAYAVSTQVSGQTSSLSQALIGALQPVIASREGAANRYGMLRVAQISCRLASFLVIIFACPLLVEVTWVLKAWLKTPPPFATSFCACMLIMLVLDKMSVGYMLAANAYGKKMIVYEFVNGLLLLSSMPLSWGCFKLGLSPCWLPVCLCVTMLLYSCARVNFCRWQMGVSFKGWVLTIAVPVLVIMAASVALGRSVSLWLPSSFVRVCVVSFVSGGSAVVLGGYLLLTSDERRRLLGIIARRGRK